MVSAGNELVQASLDSLIDKLRKVELPAHEVESPAAKANTVGFRVAPVSAVFGAADRRICMVHEAARACMRRRTLSGRAVELPRWTRKFHRVGSAGLLEGLSAHVFTAMSTVGFDSEQRAFAGLLSLMDVSWPSPWADFVVYSDASEAFFAFAIRAGFRDIASLVVLSNVRVSSLMVTLSVLVSTPLFSLELPGSNWTRHPTSWRYPLKCSNPTRGRSWLLTPVTSLRTPCAESLGAAVSVLYACVGFRRTVCFSLLTSFSSCLRRQKADQKHRCALGYPTPDVCMRIQEWTHVWPSAEFLLTLILLPVDQARSDDSEGRSV